MSKKVIIPRKNILKLMTEPLNENVINKIEYKEFSLVEEINSIIKELNMTTFTTKMEEENVVLDKVFGSSYKLEIQDTSNSHLENYKITNYLISIPIKIDVETLYVKIKTDMLVFDGNNQLYSLRNGEEKDISILRESELNDVLKEGIYFSTLNETEILFTLRLKRYLDNTNVNFKEWYNHELKFYADQSNEEKKDKNISINYGKNVFALTTNEFMNNETTYNNISINEYNSNIILDNYINGKPTINLEIIENDYFDYENNLAISKEKGETLNVGDIFRYYKKDGNLSKEYKITNREFNYNGVIKIILKAKEV